MNTYLDIVSSRRTIRAAALMYWSLGEAALEAVARAAAVRAAAAGAAAARAGAARAAVARAKEEMALRVKAA